MHSIGGDGAGRLKTSSRQLGEFLSRVQWRNLAALAAVLLIVVAIVWVCIDLGQWPRCLIIVAAAYPLAILSLEKPL